MPLPGIVALDTLRLVLADVVATRRQGGVVRRPVIRAEQAHVPGLQPTEQALERDLVAAAALPVDQPPRGALEGLPDPEPARFFSTKCHISSISTTTARPAGSGLGQCSRAWSLTQRITLAVIASMTLLELLFVIDWLRGRNLRRLVWGTIGEGFTRLTPG